MASHRLDSLVWSSTFDDAIDQRRGRLRACVSAKGGTSNKLVN